MIARCDTTRARWDITASADREFDPPFSCSWNSGFVELRTKKRTSQEHTSQKIKLENNNVNRTFWTKTREHRTTRTRTKMSLLSMLSQNRLLQQNQQSMPQLTQPFQVNIMVFMFWLWAMALNDQSRVSPRDVTPPAPRGNTKIRAHSSFTADHSFKIKFRDRKKPKKSKFPRIFI